MYGSPTALSGKAENEGLESGNPSDTGFEKIDMTITPA
jgi:hypothetical protein